MGFNFPLIPGAFSKDAAMISFPKEKTKPSTFRDHANEIYRRASKFGWKPSNLQDPDSESGVMMQHPKFKGYLNAVHKSENPKGDNGKHGWSIHGENRHGEIGAKGSLDYHDYTRDSKKNLTTFLTGLHAREPVTRKDEIHAEE